MDGQGMTPEETGHEHRASLALVAREPAPWPATRTPAGPPWAAPAPRFRPIAGLGRAVQVLLAVSALAAVAAFLAGARAFRVLARVESRGAIDVDTIESAELLHATAGAVELLLVLATGVLFIVWLYRAHSNLRAFGAAGLRFTPGWAIGGWFVPFLNLVRPMQVVNEIWSASGSEWTAGTAEWKRHAAPTWLQLWWVSWLAAWLVPWLVARDPDELTDIGGAVRDASVLMLSRLLLVPAALVAVALVEEIVGRQHRRAARAWMAPAHGWAPAEPSRRLTPATTSIVAAVGVLLVGGVLIAFLLQSRDPSEALIPIEEVEVGDCVDETPPSDSLVVALPVVDCGRPHDAEVFGRTRMRFPGDAPFPRQSQFDAVGSRQCSDHFMLYANERHETSDFDLYVVNPTEEGWESGDREILCVADAASGPLTESIAESGR
jgi:hypothetical protein